MTKPSVYCRLLPIPEVFPLSEHQESDLLLHLLEGLSGSPERLLSALLHAVLKVALVSEHAIEFRLHGRQHIRHSLADRGLEVAVALAGELALDLLKGLVGDCGVDGHEIDDTVLALLGADNRCRCR